MAEVPLPQVMRLRAALLPEPLPPAAASAFEEAKARCVGCRTRTLCNEALRAGDARAFSLFCANIHYIQQLRSGNLLPR
jgi:hypothetical protein